MNSAGEKKKLHIVFDNAPYHSIWENKLPPKYMMKQTMINGGEQNYIFCQYEERLLFELI